MVLKIVNVAAFMIMIIMNYLANALPLNNRTTGELSDQYPNLFTPAGITFSIWGIIYLLLLGFCVAQFLSRNRAMVESIGWLFALSCLLNAIWIVTWHYEKPGISLVIMMFLLVSLIMINYRLISYGSVITRAAFGIYLGWICIATIANVTVLLVDINWQGWGISDEIWAAVMVLAGSAIGILVVYRFSNPFTGLALIWALAGIMIARWPENKLILITAAISIIIVAIISVLVATVRKTDSGIL